MVPLLEQLPPFCLAWHHHWRCWLEGYQVTTPWASVFIRCPTSSLGWTGAGGKEIVLWAPTLLLVVQGQEVEMVALGEPTLPSQKVWPPSHLHQNPHFPNGFSQGVGGGFWGVQFSSWSAASKQRSSMSCHNSLSTRSPRFACRCCGVLPWGWGLLGEEWGSSSSSGGRGWVLDGSTFTAAI